MKKYNFMNQIYVGIDLNSHPSFPTLHDGKMSIGFQSYPTNKEEHAEDGYFSLEEAEKFFDMGLATENLQKNEEGNLFLRTEHLSYIQPIQIVNGLVFCADEKYENLTHYLKKIGLAHEHPLPVQMMAGVKNLEVLEEGFKLSYTYQPPRKVNLLFIKEMIVGQFNHLLNLNPKMKVTQFHYDEETYCLSFVVSKNKLLSSKINSFFQKIDLCLFFMYHSININAHFSAIKQCVRDLGQFHWLNEPYEENKQSRFWSTKTPSNLS